ncbi:MAG: hypothetical protein ACTHQM_11685 [Thermoanaerobaculia bacterium]
MATIAAILIATMYAVVIATGVLFVFLTAVAWAKGLSLVEYLNLTFPRYRGEYTPFPKYGYLVFSAYVLLATSVAIHARKRVADAWLQRRRRQK